MLIFENQTNQIIENVHLQCKTAWSASAQTPNHDVCSTQFSILLGIQRFI